MVLGFMLPQQTPRNIKHFKYIYETQKLLAQGSPKIPTLGYSTFLWMVLCICDVRFEEAVLTKRKYQIKIKVKHKITTMITN
jgi:3-hydroxymyristoyl/3-hydroxydecanoyl-(acyl carrier protein) dehydratase